MNDIIISLRLGGLGDQYDALCRRLSALGAEYQHESVWILRSTLLIPSDIRSELRPYLHPSDTVLVARLARAAALAE